MGQQAKHKPVIEFSGGAELCTKTPLSFSNEILGIRGAVATIAWSTWPKTPDGV